MEKNKKIVAKNYYSVVKNRNFVYTISMVFLMGICVLQFLQNTQLKKDVKKRGVVVAINDKLYNAVEAAERAPGDNQYFGISKAFMYNMFSHDESTFEPNTKMAKPLITEKDYLYVLKSFKEADGSDITDFYKKHDAQTIYEMDSIVMETIEHGKLVSIYGKRRAVFANTEDFLEPFNAQFKVIPWRDSRENPFGLKIKDFDFVK